MAVAALVLGIIGLLLSWLPFIGLGLCVLALVFGVLSRKRARAAGVPAPGIGTAGMVLGIIGTCGSVLVLLAAVASPLLLGSKLGSAKCRTSYAEAMTIQQAVAMYRADHVDCPKSLDELFNQKFLVKPPLDPWGTPYFYKCPGESNPESADVWSAGADRKEGTADDVKGWVGAQVQCP